MAGPVDPGVRARFAAACAGAMRAADAGDAAAAVDWTAAALAIGGALNPAAAAGEVRRELMDTLARWSPQIDPVMPMGPRVTLAILVFRLLARAPVGLAATLAEAAPDVGPRSRVTYWAPPRADQPPWLRAEIAAARAVCWVRGGALCRRPTAYDAELMRSDECELMARAALDPARPAAARRDVSAYLAWASGAAHPPLWAQVAALVGRPAWAWTSGASPVLRAAVSPRGGRHLARTRLARIEEGRREADTGELGPRRDRRCGLPGYIRILWNAPPAGAPPGRDPLAPVGEHLGRRVGRHRASALAAAAAATAALGRRSPRSISYGAA